MKKNNVKIGDQILKLGLPCKKSEYYKATVMLGKKEKLEKVKICVIVRVDAYKNCSRIKLSNNTTISDYRPVSEVALLLPYNHFGFYRRGCIFCMHRVKSRDIKARKIILDNGSIVKIGTKAIYKRFEEDYYQLKR